MVRLANAIRVVLVAALAFACLHELLAWRRALPTRRVADQLPLSSLFDDPPDESESAQASELAAAPASPQTKPSEGTVPEFTVQRHLPGYDTFNYTALVERCATRRSRMPSCHSTHVLRRLNLTRGCLAQFFYRRERALAVALPRCRSRCELS